MALGDFTGQTGTDTAIGVDDLDAAADGTVVLQGSHQFSVGEELILKDRSVAVGLVAVAKPGAIFGAADRGQQAGEIHTLGLGQINRASLEQIGATDQLLEAADAEQAHQLTHFLSDVPEEIDDMLRNAGEALAQVLLLRGHTHRAVVGVTNASHDAALGDHRDRAEAVFLGPQQGSDHHIPACFQASIGAQQNPIAQTVLHQGTMHLGEAQFPGAAGVLDRTQGRCTGATVVTGDLDHIGVGLGHTRSDGANPDLGHQLHAHGSSGMHLMQVMDQLRQVFNRIDVVVWRR